jgi:hypothetical protein
MSGVRQMCTSSPVQCGRRSPNARRCRLGVTHLASGAGGLNDDEKELYTSAAGRRVSPTGDAIRHRSQTRHQRHRDDAAHADQGGRRAEVASRLRAAPAAAERHHRSGWANVSRKLSRQMPRSSRIEELYTLAQAELT